jgi:hypothetical protein
MAEIVERTDGIPLFVEEMTKAVLEAESEGAARGTVAAVPSSKAASPDRCCQDREAIGALGRSPAARSPQLGCAARRTSRSDLW